MALVFPKSDLIQGLKLRDGWIMPQWRQESSTTAGGQSILKDMGPMLWAAFYETAAMSRDDAIDVETDLMTLQGGINLFEGYDPRRALPKSDDQSILAGVTLNAIRSDRQAVRLTGLPAGFEVSKSDYLSINDGLNLHLLRAATSAVASSTGLSGWFEVRGALRAGVEVGQLVNLRYPCARFMIEKDTISRQRVSERNDAISFSAIQVIL